LPVKNVDQQKWSYFFAIKDAVYAKLETLRNDKIINKNNQARVELEFDNKFDFNEAALAKYLNIAKVKFINQKSSKITVNATDAKLIKCERC
jgi:isoleucyl-tRNA synthetase